MKNPSSAFSRRAPDAITEELAAALSKTAAYEFKPLFEIVFAKLRSRNAAGGGEELLRLRVYEKLQNMVYDGSVKKIAKKYRGVASALAALTLLLESQKASYLARKLNPVAPAPEELPARIRRG